MVINKYIYWLLCIFLLLGMFPLHINARDCEVLRAYDDGSRLVKVGQDTLLAITEKTERNLLKLKTDLEALRHEVTVKDSLIRKYEETITQYDSTLQDLRNYTSELEGVKEDYKDLMEKYKQLSRPTLTMDAGIGITGESVTPALMPGIAYKRYHLWTFFQRDNFGVLVGTSFRLW